MQQEQLPNLIDLPVDLPIEDQRDKQLLDLARADVELGRDEGDRDARIRSDDLEEDLRADVLEEVLYVCADEWVAHHRARVLL